MKYFTIPRTSPTLHKTALSIENRQHSCLLMNALPVSKNVANRQHPCLPSKKGRWHGWYNFFACCTVFRYSCLYNSETIPSRDGGDCECVEAFTVALPSFQSLTPCTNPSKTALSHSLFVMPTSIFTIRFHIRTILFAFRRVRVCVCFLVSHPCETMGTHAKASLPCLPLPLHQSLLLSLIFVKEHLSLALLAPPETSL